MSYLFSNTSMSTHITGRQGEGGGASAGGGVVKQDTTLTGLTGFSVEPPSSKAHGMSECKNSNASSQSKSAGVGMGGQGPDGDSRATGRAGDADGGAAGSAGADGIGRQLLGPGGGLEGEHSGGGAPSGPAMADIVGKKMALAGTLLGDLLSSGLTCKAEGDAPALLIQAGHGAGGAGGNADGGERGSTGSEHRHSPRPGGRGAGGQQPPLHDLLLLRRPRACLVAQLGLTGPAGSAACKADGLLHHSTSHRRSAHASVAPPLFTVAEQQQQLVGGNGPTDNHTSGLYVTAPHATIEATGSPSAAAAAAAVAAGGSSPGLSSSHSQGVARGFFGRSTSAKAASISGAATTAAAGASPGVPRSASHRLPASAGKGSGRGSSSGASGSPKVSAGQHPATPASAQPASPPQQPTAWLGFYVHISDKCADYIMEDLQRALMGTLQHIQPLLSKVLLVDHADSWNMIQSIVLGCSKSVPTGAAPAGGVSAPRHA